VIEPSPAQLSSDAGLLPIREFDERIDLTRPSPTPSMTPATTTPAAAIRERFDPWRIDRSGTFPWNRHPR
jgi:hypothetical protein